MATCAQRSCSPKLLNTPCLTKLVLMQSSSRNTLLLSLALLALTALTYWSGLSGSFLFDDYPNIVTNERIHSETLSWPSLKKAANGYEPGVYGRPLATISFAVNYALGGKDAWTYKLTNLLVHLANALLMFWLLLRVLAQARAGRPWSPLGAFTIALIWAVHPLQVSSVLYVVQRMETLALTFVLLALIAYVHGRVAQRDGRRGWPWLLASALFAGIGMLSKETAALYPAYAFALELTVLRFEARTPTDRKLLKTGYAIGLGIALIGFFAWVLPQHMADAVYENRNFTLGERLLTQLRVLPMYIGQILLPLPSTLTFYYDTYSKSSGLLDPATTLAGGVFLLALIAGAWKIRERLPLTSLGIFWFFAAHVLTSNVFNLELVFEHRNYFALVGILLALADLVHHIPLRDGPALRNSAVVIVVAVFGFLGTLRSAVWGDPLHLAMKLVEKNPESPRASNDLATLYIGLSRSDPNSPLFSMGAMEFERGSRLPNASPLPEQGLILMAATTGQKVKAEWWDRLVHKISTRPIGPQEIMAVTGLMKQRYEGISLDDQRLSQAYSTLLSRKAMPPQFYAQYGDFALNYLKDEALAERMFVTAINRNPDDADYAAKIFATLTADGHENAAAAVYQQALTLGLMVPATELPIRSNTP